MEVRQGSSRVMRGANILVKGLGLETPSFCEEKGIPPKKATHLPEHRRMPAATWATRLRLKQLGAIATVEVAMIIIISAALLLRVIHDS